MIGCVLSGVYGNSVVMGWVGVVCVWGGLVWFVCVLVCWVPCVGCVTCVWCAMWCVLAVTFGPVGVRRYVVWLDHTGYHGVVGS